MTATDGLRAAVLAEIRPWRQALSHAVRRDHEHKPQVCSGCDEAEALLGSEPSPALDALCARAEEAEALADALRDYERWEADVILDGECWAPDGEAPLPRLTQELWDRLIVLQGKRNAALARYDHRVQAGGLAEANGEE